MAADKEVILITGGNTGLGLEAVRALAATTVAYDIVIGCRTLSKGEDAIAIIKQEQPHTSSSLSTVQVDLESDSSIEKAVETIASRHGQLDVLVNNGGASFDSEVGADAASIRRAFNKSWDTNVTGTHVLTTLAVPLLLKSNNPRLIFITSGTACLAETERMDTPVYQRLNNPPEKGWPKPKGPMARNTSYRTAKTGLNMLAREWHTILRNDGVKVWAVSPGFLATGLAGVGAERLRQMGAMDPSIGGQFLRDVVQGKRDDDAGKAIRRDEVQPW